MYSSKVLKFCVFMVVLSINVFCVLFTIVYCLSRDSSFQYAFADACFLQLVLELLIYQTSECVMIDFIIPNLIYRQVQEINIELRKLNSFVMDKNVADACPTLFNVSDYFFVSNQVSSAFPSIFGIDNNNS